MKEIMAKESSSSDQGVASFIYNPADKKYPRLFEFTRPLDELEDMLISEFSGEMLSVKEIFEQHSVGRHYLKCHYKSCLRKLEEDGQIVGAPVASDRRKTKGIRTVADHVQFTFPK
jgi:hypothetical protein